MTKDKKDIDDVISNDNEFIIECKGICRDKTKCQNSANVGAKTCDKHGYMEDYTDDMLNNLTGCSCCLDMYYLPTGGTCEKCKLRSKENREKNKIKKLNLGTCKCCSKPKLKENDYCGKHQRQFFKENAEKAGKKICNNYLRGCNNLQEITYEYAACPECLEKNREKDKQRYQKNKLSGKKKTIPKSEKTLIPLKKNEKKCTDCGKNYPLDKYINLVNGKPTLTCLNCREIGKKTDHKRREEKKIWIKNNYDKVVKYWQKARKKRIDELGREEYLKIEAQRAKKWRTENQDKMEQLYSSQKTDNNHRLKYYKSRANREGIVIDLTDDQFINFFNCDCFFCGRSIDNIELNGVDRLNNDVGYNEQNCVSCCKMCNYIKFTLDPMVFIMRCEHILTYNNLIDGELNYDLIPDHMASGYNYYKNRARDKNLIFNLTEIDYEKLTRDKCYMCGKICNEYHKNGIDRYSNKEGYTIDNSRACCTECNYMKNDYEYDEFIERLKKISENIGKNKNVMESVMKKYYNYEDDIIKTEINTTNKKSKSKHQKPTSEEKQQKKLDKKIKSEEHFQTKYSPENIEKCAQELKEKRILKDKLGTMQLNPNPNLDLEELKKMSINNLANEVSVDPKDDKILCELKKKVKKTITVKGKKKKVNTDITQNISSN